MPLQFAPSPVEGQIVALRCRAAKGVLNHEMGILIRGPRGESYESMADAELVSFLDSNDVAEPRPATIEVGVVRVSGEKALVELPRQAINQGRRVWVPLTEIDAHGTALATGDR